MPLQTRPATSRRTGTATSPLESRSPLSGCAWVTQDAPQGRLFKGFELAKVSKYFSYSDEPLCQFFKEKSEWARDRITHIDGHADLRRSTVAFNSVNSPAVRSIKRPRESPKKLLPKMDTKFEPDNPEFDPQVAAHSPVCRAGHRRVREEAVPLPRRDQSPASRLRPRPPATAFSECRIASIRREIKKKHR